MGNPTGLVMPHEAKKRLIDALNLPKHVTRFELVVLPDEPVIIRCEYYPEQQDFKAEELVKALDEYELTMKNPPTAPV